MVEKNYNESLLKHEPAAVSLINCLIEIDSQHNLGNCALYHQFPFYRDTTGDGLVKANILFASSNNGIVIFQCFDSAQRLADKETASKELTNLEVLDTLIFSRLIKSDILKKSRRELKFNVTPAVFINNADANIDTNYPIIRDIGELDSFLRDNKTNNALSTKEFNELKALLEGSKVIPKKTDRILKDGIDNSKGAVLSRIESEIANFDSEQKRAALFTLDSPQRIRGLAGSGKTIILAMKVALIHIQEPEANILYTYYTKALYDYVKKLITRFYRMFSEQDPNWSKINIMHAWGGRGLEGVYYNACRHNSIPTITYREAKVKKPTDPFGYVCEDAIKYELKKQYDYCLLDEAQDFPKEFYRLCRKITKKDRVIWAYDDFQNILDIEIQNEKETFGKNDKGEYFIDFSKKDEVLQDLILHKCYRNPRKNLISAFSLGLGIYNDNNRVLQRLENNEHWQSLGFNVEQGNSNDGEKMVISRPLENSPLIKNELLEQDIFQIKVCDSIQEECEFVAQSILKDIQLELLPEDIAVISLDNKYVRTYLEGVQKILNTKGVKTFSLIDAPSDNITYRVPGHVTLATIYKAKGNESGSVYVMGVDAVFSRKDSIVERNKLFTAITRSEAWVTISGVGHLAAKCQEEFEKLQKNDFKLIFTQPSKESTRTILRDISQQQEKLAQIERITEELKRLGLTEKEITEKFISLVSGKK